MKHIEKWYQHVPLTAGEYIVTTPLIPSVFFHAVSRDMFVSYCTLTLMFTFTLPKGYFHFGIRCSTFTLASAVYFHFQGLP